MNEYQVTWERYRSWAAENMVKGARLVMMIIWCVFVLICLALMMIDDYKLRAVPIIRCFTFEYGHVIMTKTKAALSA